MFHHEEGRERFRECRDRLRHYRGEGDPRDIARGHGHGRGGWGRGWMPRDFMFGPGRGPMVRRGDVRAAILTLLVEEPMHGYQIIQRLDERSRGMWRPSAGSVYPTLQQLEDEGLVKPDEADGRKVYALTDEGRKAAAEAASARAPWEVPTGGDSESLFGLFLPLADAVRQVSHVGSPEAVAKARVILTDARRQLYRLLAEDEAGGPDEASTTDGTPGAD